MLLHHPAAASVRWLGNVCLSNICAKIGYLLDALVRLCTQRLERDLGVTQALVHRRHVDPSSTCPDLCL